MNNGKIKNQDFLVSLPLFSDMAADELDRIAQSVHEIRASRGGIIFRRGDPSVGFHIVIHGQIKLASMTPQGDEKVIEIVGPGHSFGEAVMFMEKPYVVTAEALADTLLLHVEKAAVFAALEREPKFAQKILASLSRRLTGLIADVDGNSQRSGIERVIGYLLKNDPRGNSGTLTLQANKAVIASRLNITREYFSRVLHVLQTKQLISVNGKSIAILDVDKLRNYRN